MTRYVVDWLMESLNTFHTDYNYFIFSLFQNRLYAKYGHLPDNTILVQPEACHALSSESELSSCHECYRFLHGRGNDFAVCQFEGFRKIRKKVAKPLEHALVSFSEVSFLDPVQVRNTLSHFQSFFYF